MSASPSNNNTLAGAGRIQEVFTMGSQKTQG
jgi:hypothetical protein